MKIFKPYVILILVLLIASSSYSYTKVKSFVLEPPEQLMPGVKRIAIMNFDSPGNTELGETFSNLLIEKLIDPDRGMHTISTGFLGFGEGREAKTFQEGTFTNIFEIVERDQLEQILEEQKLAMTGLIDEAQAVSIGQLLGVQAIINGKISFSDKESKFQEERTYTKDKKKYKKKVACKRRDVNTIVTMRIISTETGQVLASTQKDHSAYDKQCAEDISKLKDGLVMVNDGLVNISEQIANFMSPRYDLQSYEFDKVKTKKYREAADKAAELAETHQIDKAYAIFNALYEKDPYNPKFMYNLGIIHEVVANFDKAKELYEMAVQLDDKKDYKRAVTRIDKAVNFKNELAKLDIHIQEHVFNTNFGAAQDAMATKVRIKGKREERFKIYEQPGTTYNVITQVPGDITFKVVKKDGDWYLLELLGGKQGYIHKDNVEKAD